MIEFYKNKYDCFGCAACLDACKNNAINMLPDEEGFLYPQINVNKCKNCQACIAVCPGKNREEILPAMEYFAVKSKNMAILEKSSSGGAFTLVSQVILKAKGQVCGACFDDNFYVKHILSADIAPMRKSKYAQSDMRGVFLKIQKQLKSGKKVLFSGTPCQCHAMRLFIGKAYNDNFITMGLICRGVMSPGFWQDYVAYLGKKAPLTAFDFRDKRLKNNGRAVSYTVGETETVSLLNNDMLYRIFGRNLAMRPSCYKCPYCQTKRGDDLTVGDFWGVEKFYPKINDGMGVSLVMAGSKKGRGLLNAAKGEMLIIPVKLNEIYQEALEKPAKETMLRKWFFRDVAKKNANGHCNIEMIIKKYAAAGL